MTHAKRSLRPRLGALLTALCLGLFVTDESAAFPVDFDFSGRVTSIVDADGVLDAPSLLSQGFSAYYTVESTTTDVLPGDPTRGVYDGGLLSMTLQLGSMSLFLDPGTAGNNRMWFVDDHVIGGTPIDGYAPVLGNATGTLDGAPVTSAGVSAYLASTDTGLFSSDALQTSAPTYPASSYDYLNQVTIFGSVGGSSFQVQGTILSLPEPASGLLLGTGIACLAVRRRSGRIRKAARQA